MWESEGWGGNWKGGSVGTGKGNKLDLLDGFDEDEGEVYDEPILGNEAKLGEVTDDFTLGGGIGCENNGGCRTNGLFRSAC